MNSTAETVQAQTTQSDPSEPTKSRKPPASRKSKQIKKAAAKAKAPAAARADSFASWMDAILERTQDLDKLEAALNAEAKRRGVKATMSTLRSHLRFRQARGQLKGVRLPEAASKE